MPSLRTAALFTTSGRRKDPDMADCEKWYRKSYRRCLVDMHIPDWDSDYFLAKFDSGAYIEAMKTAGVDTAYFYCNSCTGLCNWPTKTGHMHKGLRGRDIVRELSEGLREAGINPVAYINIWSRDAALSHPDWQCIDQNGQPTLAFQWGQPGRYAECCMNSPYRDYVLSLVRELCADYDFIGLWVDMILWRIMCYCPHCRKRFRDETGYELPETVDWSDPVWRLWLKKREEWNENFFRDIISTAREYKPGLTVMCNSSYLPSYFMGESLDFFRLGEFIGGDFSMDRHSHSFECKLYNSVSANKPFEFLGSVMNPALNEHTIIKSPTHLRCLMGSTLLNNGRYGFIDAIDPSGTLNARVYQRMQGVYAFERRYEKYLRPEVDFLCDVGLYTNLESYITPACSGMRVKDAPAASRHQSDVYAMGAVLIENHIPFSVLTRYDLDRLEQFPVIVLENALVLAEDEIRRLTEYAAAGGCLYVEGETAVYGTDGVQIPGGALRELLGAQINGTLGSKVTYIRPAAGHEALVPDCDDVHLLSVNAPQLRLTACGAEPLAYVTLPLVDPEDTSKFASAISDPPGQHTDFPALLSHVYGKGRVLLSAAQFAHMRKPEQNALFRRLMALLNPAPVLETNAPRAVELSVYRQPDDARYLLNALHFPAELPLDDEVFALHGIRVTLHIPETVTDVRALPDETAVPFERLPDGRIRFTLKPLDIFDMYALHY